MNLVIHTGDHALSRLASDEFRSRWLSLYESCSWATGFQHPDFVTPWYALYADRFLPVIVVGETEEGSLAGLLTLALHADSATLVGAGERQAEYQAWLEKAETGNAFIQAAAKKLRSHFPGVDLYLKYLPADIPLDWVEQAGHDKSLFCLRPFRRPVMRIDAENMERQRRKKNHRQNFNRLKRTGEVNFEKVTDHERFARLFDVLCTQYDFRQGALHHITPFATDPAKKPFYLELHKRGMLHASVLNVGNQIAASHTGVISKGSAVHLGINTHEPALGAHSPGNLLLAMLGVHLAEESMAALDLTPGGDGYKEHFATEHDTVHELLVYGSVARRWKKEALWSAKQMVKTRMQKAGWTTADAWAAIGKIRKLKTLGVRSVLNGLPEQLKAVEKAWKYYPERASGSRGLSGVARNCIQDLMQCESSVRSMSRWEFFRTSMERMERSMDVYSYAHGGKLLACCWVRRETDGASEQGAAREDVPPVMNIVLFDLYVHPELMRAASIPQFIARILSEIKDERTGESIYFHGALSNEIGNALMECGFFDAAELNGNSPVAPPALSRGMQDISTGA